MPYVDKVGRVYTYGEFFPMEFSPWAYNETIAQEYFPLTKDQAIEKGYRWRDVETKNYVPTMLTENIPDDITKTDDSILDEVIECAHKTNCNHNCTKAFRIIGNELQFYRKIGVPVPTLCPACRTMERLKLRLGIKLYKRNCMHEGCENTFETGYPPESPEIIYCEKCYQQEVY